jgi:hypothetical protein
LRLQVPPQSRAIKLEFDRRWVPIYNGHTSRLQKRENGIVARLSKGKVARESHLINQA